MLLHPSSVPLVLDTLRENNGNPVQVLSSLEADIAAAPKVTANGENLQTLAVRTSCLVDSLTACGMEDQLLNHSLVTLLRRKLPFVLAIRWAEFCGDSLQGLEGFHAFLKREMGYALRAGQNLCQKLCCW